MPVFDVGLRFLIKGLAKKKETPAIYVELVTINILIFINQSGKSLCQL